MWAELLHCVGLEMVVQVVAWEWIFEMDMVEVMVVVEVDGRDNIELSMQDIEENIEDIMDGSHNFLANLISKIGFGTEMAKVVKEMVCSNYFQMDVHKLEIMNQALAPYQVEQICMVLLELHNIVLLAIYFLHFPLGKIP